MTAVVAGRPGLADRAPVPHPTGFLPSTLVSAARSAAPRTRTVIGAAAGSVAGVYPGLLPRSAVVEGLVVGLLATTGVVIAALTAWLWAHTVRRDGTPRGRDRAGFAALAGGAGAVTAAVAWSAQWTRTHPVAGFDAGGGWYWACAMGVAAATCALTLGSVRLCRAHPRRMLAVLTASVSLGSVAGAGLVDERPAVAESAAGTVTALPTRSGGPRSLIGGDTLGEHGRRFVADTADPRSVRAYAGLGSAPTAEARAALAVDDLVRLGGLSKSAVVVMVPTGSGWIDGAAARSFEELFDGDVAEIGVQYADTPSWVSYLFAPDDAADAARALLNAVSERIMALPGPDRPGLYVYGESLGAAAGSRALAEAPHAQGMLCGALWTGPPARFDDPVPARSTVTVNASDPVPRWDPALAVRPPEDAGPGGARAAAPPWLPVVSFVQSSVDVITSRSGPEGTGHVYGAAQGQGLTECE